MAHHAVTIADSTGDQIQVVDDDQFPADVVRISTAESLGVDLDLDQLDELEEALREARRRILARREREGRADDA